VLCSHIAAATEEEAEMGHVIKNLGSGPIYVRLHNGQHVRLSPGSSSEVDEVQVRGNPSVQKLLNEGILAIKTRDEAKASGTPAANIEGKERAAESEHEQPAADSKEMEHESAEEPHS
jgi:hypothetical protein